MTSFKKRLVKVMNERTWKSAQLVTAAYMGIGGCGMNMLESWLKYLPTSACTVAVNRDSTRLKEATGIQQHIFLAELSATNHQGQVMASIKEHMGELEAMVQRQDVIFLLAGLGGATGTWASQFLCDQFLSMGKQVVMVLVMPFSFECKRVTLAEEALAGFDGMAHRVLCYNDYLIRHAPEGTSMTDAFELLGMSDG
ncbi:MAG: hypothetical protein COW18_08440 [Zetaproteobacteria bacterium CG12_big_fil_rev_8_21_14_0_65_54_13]|nr:MAG: hypothetical protein COW18_08440 [Zetaproteobacteria bacterium CG12_big_fil_rev_8_21_14_0_65_54_13]PIX54689.1 MAG: hypothetical protein COZ50_06600 [Zetaproteobacteria bacterium CG_4_10_14_3_um_filter_54_28]PJA30948.1 MAG: hypothetical protein CO188_01100 [Zetaproteobacteria bacterium CG_4_9_14_3_um_filter_54_145]